MADNTTGEYPAAHTPQQTPRAAEPTQAADDGSVFKMSAPWSNFMPGNTNLLSSLTGVFGPSPTADYEKKVITFPEWMPPTPAGDSAPASVVAAAAACESPPDSLLRPQPQYKPEGTPAAASFLAAPSSPRATKRSESPIDVVNTSAFAPVDQSPAKEDGAVEIVRPQPMRVDSMGTNNSLLMFSSEPQQQQQPQCPTTLASALGLSSDTVLFPTEPGPSSGEQSNASPPSKGCYTRAPGLGPPPETPTSTNGQNSYVCAICGFSCASKFHYNSHMNTHGDHQCTMCDYTSRTEGRLKKHMRESHTVEQQLAAGLEVSPPPAAAAAASSNSSPSKENTSSPMEEDSGDVETPSVLSIPSTLSSTLLGMIATSTASSMTSALEQMRAITEQPLMGDGSNDGLLLVGTPLSGLLPMREEGMSGGGGGGGGRRKAKIYKCKQCPIISTTKEDSWAHARTHIPSDKQMSCDKCGFVTEYKHHLEYHQRNHAGIKPFQCKKCAYTCVNKSMLNSHMKSHSNVYQFRCADCNYATKYCHSLKLHLKKYGHRRNTEGLTEAELLNSLSTESSPPTMRKDSTASIATSLSGPFTPFGIVKREEPTTPLSTPTMPSFNLQSIATSQNGLSYASQLQHLLRQHQYQQMLEAQSSHKCCFCDFTCGSNEELTRHNITHLLSNGSLYQALGVQASLGIPDRSGDDDHHTTTGSPSGDDAVSHSNGSAGSPLGSGRGSSDEGEGGSSRRKSSKPSRIIGIDELGQALMDKASPDTTVQKVEIKQEEMDTSDESAGATADITTSSSELVLPAPKPLQPVQHPLQQQLLQMQQQQPSTLLSALAANQQLAAAGGDVMPAIRQAYLAHLNNMTRVPGDMFTYTCRFCTMGWSDKMIHQTHMNFHSPSNPMQCTKCGLLCANPLMFNIHLYQSQHFP